ncbi:hypothetical protein [Deinococcus sp.]|uniref:hypothetical protein n=1 Tax=Deinococcus sp. TaxID=47478 RepID=UPI0025F6F032|nr:hypothetical protein [Deinococcus sp.]
MLYRKQSGPAALWLTVATSLVTLALGFFGGRLSAPQGSLQSLLQPEALHLRRASGALEIVGLEYARARGGNAQSQAASLKAIEQAQRELSELGALRQLYPQDAAQLGQQLALTSQAIRQSASQETVRRRVDQIQGALSALTARVPR